MEFDLMLIAGIILAIVGAVLLIRGLTKVFENASFSKDIVECQAKVVNVTSNNLNSRFQNVGYIYIVEYEVNGTTYTEKVKAIPGEPGIIKPDDEIDIIYKEGNPKKVQRPASSWIRDSTFAP